MSKMARHLVSQKKKRTVDKSVPKGSVDLDLTEIHPGIVCMGYPATGVEALYRNSYEDSLRYLDHKYGDNYMVYNLCGEKAYQYSSDRFHGRVRCFPFLDHQACPLALMPGFVSDAMEWLSAGPERTVVIHCKAGKGRTGIMACCLLMAIDPTLNGSATAAMLYYGKKRTEDGKGLTVPSQRRSVVYYERLRNEFGGPVPIPVPTVAIHEIRLSKFQPTVSVHWLSITTNDQTVDLHIKEVKRGESPVKTSSSFRVTESGVHEDMITLDCRDDPRFHSFCGDIKLTIRDGNGTAGILSINTLFIHKRYDSNGIDKLNKRFDVEHPCAIEFEFTVTDGCVPSTPTPATPSESHDPAAGADAKSRESEEESDEENNDARYPTTSSSDDNRPAGR